MRLLDKYVLKEFLAPFLFGVAAFTAIFLGADTLLKIAGFVSQYGASAISAVKVFILALPRIIVYTFPMAVLLGSLMCFSRLSGASELIVMRTSGQSFFRLALQFFFHLLVRKSRAGNLQLRNFLLFRRQARVLPLQFRNLFQKIFVARHRLFKPYDFSDTDTDQEENSHPDG